MKDKCLICDKVCKNSKHYDGWHSLCSKECLEKWYEENGYLD